MRTKEIKVQVTYREGYQKRFTAACLEQIRKREARMALEKLDEKKTV